MVQSRPVISFMTFLSQGTLGLSFGIIGSTIPVIKAYFGFSLKTAGLVVSTVQIGYAFAAFGGGIVTDLMKRERLLAIGSLFIGLSALLIGFFRARSINFMLFLIMGIGCGAIFISSNTLVVQLFPERRGTFLNIHHVFFAGGSFVGPLLSRFFLRNGPGWQVSYRILGIITSTIGLFFLVVETGRKFGHIKPRFQDTVRLLKQRKYFILLIINFFGMGTQFLLMYMIVLFLKEVRGFDVAFASLFLSMFYVMLGFGRLICGFAILKTGNARMILVLFSLLLIFVAFALYSSGLVSGVFFILTGLASSGIFPGMLALTSIITGEKIMGASLGLLTLFGGLGGMLMTYTITNISEIMGLVRGFLMVILILVGIILLFSIMLRSFISAERKVEQSALI